MSTTIDQIAEFLDEQELSYGRHETEAAILLTFRIGPGETGYRDHSGEANFTFLIRVQEDGEFLSVSMPWTWNLADCPHAAAVFAAVLGFQARSKLIRFDFDPDDGELRANTEIGIEDSMLTSSQLHRLLKTVGNAVLELDPVIRHAMRTGEVDMHRLADLDADDGDRSRLQEFASAAGGVEALEELVCGDPSPSTEASDPTDG